jgi:hypothetical protein
MKRALLIVALLGVLACIGNVALIVVLPHLAQTPSYVPLATTDGYLEWVIPALGLITGIVGAITAKSGRWLTIFIALAAISVFVPATALFAGLVLFFLFITPHSAADAFLGVMINAALLSPVVSFVGALIYTLRPAARLSPA